MYYFIMNPSARSEGSGSIWNRIAAALSQENIPYKAFVTKHPGHGREIAASISSADPQATVIAVGGDGSIHDILCGLTHLDTVTFGVIPSGSGNDFARGMGLKQKSGDAIRTALHPAAFARMDVGQFTDRPDFRFGVSSGIGFDASICHEALHSRIKNFLNFFHAGQFTYSLLAAKQIALYQPGPMTIIIDGKERHEFPRVFFAAVMNQKYQGGGLMLTPSASPEDGLLDVFVCGDIPRLKLLAVLPTGYKGKHTHFKGVHFLRGKSVEIITDRKRPVHLDGESGGFSRTLQAGLCPDQLRVIVG